MNYYLHWRCFFGNKPQTFYKFNHLNSEHLQIAGKFSVTEIAQYLEILQ